MGDRWIALREGLFEHTERNAFSAIEFAALVHMMMFADSYTGIWSGSAKALVGICGTKIMKERTAKEVLASLHDKGYIKRLHVQGVYGNYPVLIHKYEVSRGDNKGKLLDAHASDWDADLVYVEKQEQRAERKLSLAAFAGARTHRVKVSSGTSDVPVDRPEHRPVSVPVDRPVNSPAHRPYSTQPTSPTRLDRATYLPADRESEEVALMSTEEEQKVVSGSVEHSEEEIASLISACYRAAGKKPVMSIQSKGDAMEALQSRSLEDLLALAEWAATDHYWGRLAFPGADRPVSMLAKKQDLIATRMNQALSKGKQPVQLRRAVHAPTHRVAAPPAEKLNFGDWCEKRKADEMKSGWGRGLLDPSDEDGYAEYLTTFERVAPATSKPAYRKTIPPFVADLADENDSDILSNNNGRGDWGITL